MDQKNATEERKKGDMGAGDMPVIEPTQTLLLGGFESNS